MPKIASRVDGRFVPRIAATFPLERIVNAYRCVESAEKLGRVVVIVGPR